MTRPKKDSRLFARIDLDYADHPKIAGLSDAAFRAHIEMILYSRKYLTDGRVARRVANRVGSEVVAELMSNDGEHPSLIELPNGDYLLHGYEDMQETKAEVASRSARNRRNGAGGGRKSGGESATESRGESRSENEASRVAETETETETETDTSPNGEVARKRAAPKRGTRIPDEFFITEEMKAWAAVEVPGLDVGRSTRMFVDYWRAKAGRDATKLDWVLTWKNWLRRDHEKVRPVRAGAFEAGLSLVERTAAMEQERGEIGA